jgi:hypothetical protein
MLEGALLAAGHTENLCGATVCQTLLEKNERDQRIARGREFAHRVWGHDDDEDFQQNRRHGTRRHCSLSGCARSSRCRGGLDDCISQAEDTGLPPHSVVAARPAVRWIPMVKTKSDSFVDPLISAVWSRAIVEGPEGEESFNPAGDMKSGDHAAL